MGAVKEGNTPEVSHDELRLALVDQQFSTAQPMPGAMLVQPSSARSSHSCSITECRVEGVCCSQDLHVGAHQNPGPNVDMPAPSWH
jgi:hypothetical protein